MAPFDLFSIGHSNIAADRFIAMLRAAGANAIADVRSTPVSRRFPWFSAGPRSMRLRQEGMTYLAFGDGLGGRPREPGLYADGVADYEAMTRRPAFGAGIEALLASAQDHRICLMCAEREPLDCHRCLLVTRALAQRSLTVGHILHNGTIEPHAATEQRLLALNGMAADLFITGQDGRLAAAYRSRARAVAYRARPGSPGATSAARAGRPHSAFGKDRS